ncbi:MAG: hypothetical protein JXB34_07840 [Bacteroidales bacterium]|nr:hypothetical protein [Bacteroidales bacterium]
MEPVLKNPEMLTESITRSIQTIDNTVKHEFRFRTGIFIRQLAAAIALLIISIAYYQQKIYISRSVIALNDKYQYNSQQSRQTESFNECLVYSVKQVKYLLKTDDKFAKSILDITAHYSEWELKKMATQICLQGHTEFEQADENVKKEFLLKQIKANLN